MRRQCSMLKVQCSMNDQWSMINEKLMKTVNCKLKIALGGTSKC
ncbi:MAG: hypothetical protein UX30_C0003G0019 [Candidatus Saccharibacteria bacterium GW2011_GWA2_46_10]|nr:MAG: hypothetical protein UX30_C0003G0019 [Candidatus Saccharibacteria bacterium GW2011_GWA2_46_10]